MRAGKEDSLGLQDPPWGSFLLLCELTPLSTSHPSKQYRARHLQTDVRVENRDIR